MHALAHHLLVCAPGGLRDGRDDDLVARAHPHGLHGLLRKADLGLAQRSPLGRHSDRRLWDAAAKEALLRVLVGQVQPERVVGSAELRENITSGAVQVAVGTHSLLSDKVSFGNLGLLIVDEEQRFGVKQKEKIKGAPSPSAVARK